MRFIISKNTIQSVADEVTEIANLISDKKEEGKVLDFKKAAKASKKDGMKYFQVYNNERTFEVVIDDEVFFIILDSYRAIAKPLNLIYQGCKLLASDEIQKEYKRILEKLNRKA